MGLAGRRGGLSETESREPAAALLPSNASVAAAWSMTTIVY